MGYVICAGERVQMARFPPLPRALTVLHASGLTLKESPARAGLSLLRNESCGDRHDTHPLTNSIYLHMLQRTLPAGFIAPCLPTKNRSAAPQADWNSFYLNVQDANRRLWSTSTTVCRQSISDSWLGNLRECLAHLV